MWAMRKGFRSSRGAMRGTMGGAAICLVGAVGFATVAIGFGPFVYAICLRNSVFTWPEFKNRSMKISLSICRKLPNLDGVSIAAGRGTEVQKLAPFPQRNGTRFVNVHAAHGIAHEPARRSGGLRQVRDIHGARSSRCGVAEHPADKAT